MGLCLQWLDAERTKAGESPSGRKPSGFSRSRKYGPKIRNRRGGASKGVSAAGQKLVRGPHYKARLSAFRLPQLSREETESTTHATAFAGSNDACLPCEPSGAEIMTATKLWDAKFLFERERCAREEAVAALTDADWQEASAQFERELSDHVRGYRDCRDAACGVRAAASVSSRTAQGIRRRRQMRWRWRTSATTSKRFTRECRSRDVRPHFAARRHHRRRTKQKSRRRRRLS